MEYVTHLREDGSYQPLKEHLEGTATRSAKFAASFGASSHAERTALLHDIGKYSPNGQRRQRDPEHTAKVDHSTAGAKAAADLGDMPAAFAIAGHHGGLPDLGTRSSLDDGTLCARLNKKLTGGDDPSAWRSEISLPTGVQPTPPWLPRNDVRLTAMYIRMLFSCLVDADFLDTERALSKEEKPRGIGDSMPALLEKLQAHVAKWLEEPKSDLCALRNEVLRRCLRGSEDPQGLYSLTVPTGGGKTVSSLAFALSHAVKHDMKRIIYVIPYTSIIDQNAKVFREILGDENVVEHHSQVDLPDTDAETPDALRKRLACENWDAPVIVTTAVQFFESFYAAKPGRCRKLHNVANSVVIFDEAQTLPISLMRPCVSVIDQLVQHYGVTAVLCTATQPELLSIFSGFTAGNRIQELVPDPDALFSSLHRVTFQQDGTLSDEELAARIRQENAVLCIVNSRKQARSLYEALPEEERFHLSTLMNAIDRERTIATIRERLDKKQCCRVISTSLIEAGVDVDFPTVYRELAGLDSILQAAGRCNREGKEAAQDSIVHIYQTEHAVPPIMRPNIESCRTVLRLYAEDIGSRKAIHAYFCDLLFKRGENQQRSRPVSSENDLLDTSKTLSSEARFAFRETAEHFRFIDTDTVTVYIPTPENSEDIKALRDGHYSRELFRRLGRCGVSIYRREYQALCSIGGVTEITDAHCGILSDIKLYTPECGLQVSCTSGLGLFA
jgi:CRISPR-associated endonuclease/helicase Cas3